jgi:hypothetical protein
MNPATTSGVSLAYSGLNRAVELMFVAGVDGCRAGWVCFKVEVTSLATSVEIIDLCSMFSQNRWRQCL